MALLLLAIYAVDVLAGKAAAVAAFRLPVSLGDVGQFVVVLAMAVSFVTGLLREEGSAGGREGQESSNPIGQEETR